jgi:hypothetical protein
MIQGVPLTHEHLGPGMELDSGSSKAMEMGPADAEWLIRNAEKLNWEISLVFLHTLPNLARFFKARLSSLKQSFSEPLLLL